MNTPLLDKYKLAEITKQYFDLCKDEKYERWQVYLGNLGNKTDYPELNAWQRQWGINEFTHPLLHLEMAYAKSREAKARASHSLERFWPDVLPESKNRRTLVILVGASFEPLLQLIWAYQPHRLVPVLNTFYGDRLENSNQHIRPDAHWNNLTEKIERLPQAILKNFQIPKYSDKYIAQDNPNSVFNLLQAVLKDDLADPQCEVVIDVTGAKKTMVAGAYLFAAHTRAKISYVDFDRFDAGMGRPYGYTCRITNISNPIEDFALDFWGNLRQAYEEYNFGLARDLFTSMRKKMDMLLKDKTGEHLGDYLQICQHWENGYLKEAGELIEKLNTCLIDKQENLGDKLVKHLPSAIPELKNYSQAAKNLTDKDLENLLSAMVLTSPELLVLHATDELERAKWYAKQNCKRSAHKTPAGQEQYRLAFTKAYALYETLLLARALNVIEQEGFKTVIPGLSIRLTATTPKQEKLAFLQFLLNHLWTERALDILKGKNITIGFDDSVLFGKLVNKISFTLSSSNWKQIGPLVGESLKIFDRQLKNARNLVVHTYIPVSPNWAEQAIKIAELSLDDYIENWAEPLGTTTKALREIQKQKIYTVMPWKKVKEIFQLDFIPEQKQE